MNCLRMNTITTKPLNHRDFFASIPLMVQLYGLSTKWGTVQPLLRSFIVFLKN